MEIYQIHCIDKLEYVDRFDKYVATLQFHQREKGTFWLSAKQANRLNIDMGDGDYSRKNNVVWCVIDESSSDTPRFVWSSRNDSGRAWLEENFLKEED